MWRPTSRVFVLLVLAPHWAWTALLDALMQVGQSLAGKSVLFFYAELTKAPAIRAIEAGVEEAFPGSAGAEVFSKYLR